MTALDGALQYIERGWSPVPLPYKKKKPVLGEWQHLRITKDDAPRYFNGAPQNVGVLMGSASQGLSDVDLDVAEAVAVAPYLLPRTSAIFGRTGHRSSHWLYRTTLAEVRDVATIEYIDPCADGDEKGMLVELRIGGGGKGAQTVFPGSVHETGEPIAWEQGCAGDPADVDGADLETRVARVAAAALLAKHWRNKVRHKAALAIGGMLAHGGWTMQDAAVFVEAVARAAGDKEWQDRVKAVRDSFVTFAKGEKVRGLPSLLDLIDERVARKAADWLALRDSFGFQRRATGGDRASASENTGHSWDDPDMSILEDRRGTLPPFPIDTLPALSEWLIRAAKGAGVTPGHIAVPLLSITSSMIGTARRVRASRPWSEPVTLWTALVGFSGTGKTPGIDVTTRALKMVENSRRSQIADMRRKHEARVETAKAAAKKWKAEVQEAIEAGRRAPDMPVEATDPGPFVPPRLYVSDITTERLAVLLQARPRGLALVVDELAGLFLNMNRYSNGSDREFWLQAWNGRAHVVERQGRPPVVLDHLLVGITGGFQPDKLVKCFSGDEDGMYARVLLGWPEEPAYQALCNDGDEIEPEFQNALNRIADLRAEDEDGNFVSRAVCLSDEAVEEFEQFRHFLHGYKDAYEGREREWIAKGPGQVLRLAGTLVYLDWAMAGGPEPEQIGCRFMVAAIRLWREYFLPHSRAALRLIGLSDKHATARKALRWIRANGKDGVSVKDIRRDALAQRLDADETQSLIDGLVKTGWLRETTDTRAFGRPARRWAVNPRLFE